MEGVVILLAVIGAVVVASFLWRTFGSSARVLKTANQFQAASMEAVAAIAERTRKAGKYAATYVIEPAIAGRLTGMGYQLLAMGSEHALITLGARTLLAGVKESIAGK